jgi:uncharacterized protein YjbJ (UPF0337 family)
MATGEQDRRTGTPAAATPTGATTAPGQQGSGGSEPGVVDQIQEKAGQVVGQVQEKTGPVVDQAQEKVGQAAEQAREQATSRLESQKERAVVGLGSVTQALRQTGQELRGQDQGAVAQYLDVGAEQIERFTSYLRQHDVEQIVAEAQNFARRQPTLFLGGAFALGLLGARLLKSSGQRASVQSRQPMAMSGRLPSGAPSPTPRAGGMASSRASTTGSPGTTPATPSPGHVPATPSGITPSSVGASPAPPGRMTESSNPPSPVETPRPEAARPTPEGMTRRPEDKAPGEGSDTPRADQDTPAGGVTMTRPPRVEHPRS